MDLLLEPLALAVLRPRARRLGAGRASCARSSGTYVVLRGIAFIGDAIAHAAFPGVVAAYMLGDPVLPRRGGRRRRHGARDRLRDQAGRASARTPSIGVLFAGTFALGVFLFSTIDGYVADLFSFLFGNVLAIGAGDLVALRRPGPRRASSIVALLWKELLYATFDPLGAAASGIQVDRLEYLFLALVALTIVVSLQAVGIILVVAMLVTPAATAQLLTVRFTRLMAAGGDRRDRQRRRRASTSPTGSTSPAAPRSCSSRPACSCVALVLRAARACWRAGADGRDARDADRASRPAA